jgi:hypothetical protein
VLDLPAESYDEHLALARAVIRSPDAARILLDAQANRSGDASVAAGVALYTSSLCSLAEEPCREIAARWTRLMEPAEPPIAIVNGLGEKPFYWPPALPGLLLRHLKSTRSAKLLPPPAKKGRCGGGERAQFVVAWKGGEVGPGSLSA